MNHHSPITAEGFPLIAVPVVFAVIALAFGWRIPAAILGLLTLFVTWFFRNPGRKIPGNAKFILSPADGKILRVEMYLPGGTRIMVSAGDKVRGGETPIAELP